VWVEHEMRLLRKRAEIGVATEGWKERKKGVACAWERVERRTFQHSNTESRGAGKSNRERERENAIYS